MKPFEKRSGKPEIEVKKPENPPPGRSSYVTMIIYFTLLVSLVFLWRYSVNKASTEISYSTFLELMEEGKIENAEISENLIEGTLKEKDPETQKQKEFRTIPPKNQELAALLKKHGISYSVRIESTWFYTLLSWIIPFGLIILFWLWISSKMTQTGGGAGSFLNIGNRVHIHAETLPTVTFKDVADSEEVKEELKESIDFLKDPSRIQRLGGRMPKGILLLGAPGTGKTLLARAVSGEAGVPFFNISGSEFIEMFVGVGAARVRDLFHQARDKAPCIIFIDELDAIGRTRGGPVTMGGHDEREQTLNQLLTEMDGFDPSTGVVVMAATNRPEILDRALLRAGRFDRQIIVDKPDLKAREAILKLHSKKLIISEDVDLTIVAQRTPGFVGADLANISNEAAIIAVRHDHKFVTMQDFEEAIDRIIAGPEKKHRVLNKEEKRRVAFHESGHAVTAMNVDTGDTVHKVSIIPRGVTAIGYTMQLPGEEKFLSTKKELKDRLTVLLGGRVAEELVLGDISTGAANDLERASQIARDMVTRMGMSDELGPLTYGKRQQLMFLGDNFQEEKNYSEETARKIDDEVKAIIEESYKNAKDILSGKIESLKQIAEVLQEKEIMTGEEIKEILNQKHS